jgi:hypothetical protein
MRRLMLLAACAVVGFASGCVRRVIDITSEPPGARVWVNDREAGRTPCSIEFTHYGRYDVRLQREGCEPVSGFGDADAPVWDFVGADLVSEVLPAHFTSRVSWHFTLVPTDRNEAALIQRARAMRTGLSDQPPPLPSEAGEAPVLTEPPADQVPPSPGVIPQSTPRSGG